MADRLHISGIPKRQTIQPRCNQRTNSLVPDSVAPSPERLSLPELDHSYSVVYKLSQIQAHGAAI
jgi:hypothetical protein